MRISDWSSDVCSSDLSLRQILRPQQQADLRAGDAAQVAVGYGAGDAMADRPPSLGGRGGEERQDEEQGKAHDDLIQLCPGGTSGLFQRVDSACETEADPPRPGRAQAIGSASCRVRVWQSV